MNYKGIRKLHDSVYSTVLEGLFITSHMCDVKEAADTVSSASAALMQVGVRCSYTHNDGRRLL